VVQDISQTSIKGLEQTSFSDKVGGMKESAAEKTPVTFHGETDRVYIKADKKITVAGREKALFEVTRDGLADVVVWNPWEEKAKGMADFGPASGWKNMVCVEAGSVGQWNTLEGGDTWEGGQIIKAL
jgi:glucose-6-phosphate 1-epimerase